ncbi:MAG TPA: lipase family protein [Chitinophagaceae bacterium]|nr:lipase family protein [Chitinophagaceae bacterium]
MTSCNQRESNRSAGTNKETGNKHEDESLSVKTACILSEIAYCSDPQKEIEQYLPGWKLAWNPIPVNGNYAFIVTDGKNYALAIRGSLLEFSSAALANWISNDLNVASQKDWTYTDITDAKISQGSYEGLENMNKLTDKTTGKNLWSFVKETTGVNAPLLITGHSLGGNLATVYASYLWWQWKQSGQTKNNINVITFAAPAAGNKNFAKDFDARFPNSLRIENSNDIVPKFPVSGKISNLGDLFSNGPSASSIEVGYKNVTVNLSKVFSLMSGALDLLKLTNGISAYTQTNGEGTIISCKLSGKNNSNTSADWFAEAGYQHGMAQYAAALNAPAITCGQ